MKVTQLFDTNLKKLGWVVGIALIILAYFLVQEPAVGPGDTVVLEYTISLNGTIVDTSISEIAQKANIFIKDRTYEPLIIVIGGNPGEQSSAPFAVEKQLLGMRVGEKKTIRLYPLEAYGYWNPDALVKMRKDEFIQQTGLEPVQGQTYEWGNRRFTIYQITEEYVYLDFNHRFAVNPNKVTVSRAEFEKSAKAYVGNVIMYQGQYAVVIEITDTDVVLDLNPAVFEFKVEIIQIKKA